MFRVCLASLIIALPIPSFLSLGEFGINNKLLKLALRFSDLLMHLLHHGIFACLLMLMKLIQLALLKLLNKSIVSRL
jgi:hypothetical protein